jgi:hypothetical protein
MEPVRVDGVMLSIRMGIPGGVVVLDEEGEEEGRNTEDVCSFAEESVD